MKGYANPGLLISAEELSKTLQDAGAKPPLLLDLRPPDAFAAGHIPGARHLDLHGVSLIDTEQALLKSFQCMIEHLFATRGLVELVRGAKIRPSVLSAMKLWPEMFEKR